MLIIKHKKTDYYDGVAGTTGIDKTIVYNRQTIEYYRHDNINNFITHLKSNNKNEIKDVFLKLRNVSIKKKYYNSYPFNSYFIIGFCGKLYIGWKLHSKGKNIHTTCYEAITTITYDLDYIRKIFKLKGYNSNLIDDINNILYYNAIDLFRELNTPCFIYDSDYRRNDIDNKAYFNNPHPRFIINPILKDYEFYKVFDSFQTFQEISMFLGGVLGDHEKEIVVVDDKYKIEQHGFDKWSFRKMSENKHK